MPSKRQKLFWRIDGYDSTRSIFQKIVPHGGYSEDQMITLLQRLASKHLDRDEIVSASSRRNAKIYAAHLEPSIDRNRGKRFTISVGQNPYYIASVWREEEL